MRFLLQMLQLFYARMMSKDVMLDGIPFAVRAQATTN